MHVSDKNDYISGELFATDDGYHLALLIGSRNGTASGTFSLMQAGRAIQVSEVGADEAAILHITNPAQQTVRAVIRDRDKVLSDHEYRLAEIPGVSEGLRLSNYYADEIFGA